MEQLDVEKLIGELEIAVDRLRALYEQYFMGFEKLEPTVPRKDVDRRIYVLRKEQIRNTALRFRFNMLLQRYNTYQTHWQRICREIENGTYKRHLLRARRRFSDAPGARRRSTAPPPPSRRSPTPPAPSIPPPPLPAPAALTAAMAEELAELDREFAPGPAFASNRSFTLDSEPPGPERPSAPQIAHVPPPRIPRPDPPSRPVEAGRESQPGPLWRRAPPAPPSSQPVLPVPAHAPAPAPLPGRAAAPPAVPPPSPPRPAKPAPPAGPTPPASGPRLAASPRAADAPSADPLSETRVRQLYAQYVEAKRRHNESTAAITYDAVARSLRDSSAKLREKHGKPVDFEVTVKDGKAILKPVLK